MNSYYFASLLVLIYSASKKFSLICKWISRRKRIVFLNGCVIHTAYRPLALCRLLVFSQACYLKPCWTGVGNHVGRVFSKRKDARIILRHRDYYFYTPDTLTKIERDWLSDLILHT